MRTASGLLIHAEAAEDVAWAGDEAGHGTAFWPEEEGKEEREKRKPFSGKPPGFLRNFADKPFSIKNREKNWNLRAFLQE